MVLGIFTGESSDCSEWVAALHEHLPELEVRIFPGWEPCEEIDYALVWNAPANLLARCQNLKAIISFGAGVEHITDIRSSLPRGVPIIRMADQALIDCMTEYVIMNVLLHHRSMLNYREQQDRRQWKDQPAVLARDRRIGFMGLGNMALPAARLLAGMGFDVAAWVRSERSEDGIATYIGQNSFPAFLGRTDILVCLLPSTVETEGLLNADMFKLMPPGAAVINAGRGTLINESDLIAALDSKQLSGVSLDVFRQEPLPADSPLWSHPRVLITPHTASPTTVEDAAKYVADVIGKLRKGEIPEHIVDMKHGY